MSRKKSVFLLSAVKLSFRVPSYCGVLFIKQNDPPKRWGDQSQNSLASFPDPKAVFGFRRTFGIGAGKTRE